MSTAKVPLLFRDKPSYSADPQVFPGSSCTARSPCSQAGHATAKEGMHPGLRQGRAEESNEGVCPEPGMRKGVSAGPIREAQPQQSLQWSRDSSARDVAGGDLGPLPTRRDAHLVCERSAFVAAVRLHQPQWFHVAGFVGILDD